MQENVLESKSASDTQQIEDQVWLEKLMLQNGVPLQLFLTHSIAAGCSVVVMFLFMHVSVHLATVPWIAAALLIAGGIGLLLTANIQYCIYRIETAVNAIIHRQPIRIPTIAWPCLNLFASLQELEQRVQAYIQGEQAAVGIRKHYLQRASDNATLAERQRIARDLHDSIKQQLFSISISAATARAYWEKDSSRAFTAVADIQRVVKEAQVEMQALLQQLGSAPLENTQLADALRIQAEALKYRSELDLELNIGEIPPPEVLPEHAHETIFRLVQEAFSNIARHARARSVVLTLSQTEKFLHLIIRDDGNGFDQNQVHAGMGLTNMRERAVAINGTIEFRSAPGQGTVLHIVIPFLRILEPDENQIRIQQEVKQIIERGTRAFQAGITAQNIALFLLIVCQLWVQIPPESVIISWLVAVYGLPSVYLNKRRLTQLRGKEDVDVLAFQQKEWKLWVRLLFFLFLGTSFFFSRVGSPPLLILLFMVFLFAVSIFQGIRLRWGRYRTQASLRRSIADLQGEVTAQRRRIRATISIFFIFGLTAILTHGRSLLLGDLMAPNELSIIVLVPVLFAVLLGLLFQFIQLWQKKQVLQKKLEQVAIDEKAADDR